ncbi:ATP-binding protein [Allocoleopsis sp.]|uniref:ATP-binding response regulator n=1 Tax=Allocoleopsis sp. TaxID=3088169 RepID=UPI002FD72709
MTDTNSNILIVDDQPDNIRTLAAILSGQGYKVRKAVSGEMALETVRSQPPDLILLDIRMPQMNGYEVCSALKVAVETHEIPVIFLSALDEVADKAKAFDVGGADYITKPFQAEEVLLRVRHQLTIRQQQQQLIEQNHQLQREMQERQRSEAALRQAGEALRESEERFRSAFDYASTGMLLIGLDLHWLKVNCALCDMLGYSESELLTTSSSDLIYPDDIDQHQNCLQQLLGNETQRCQTELRYCCKLGRIIWVFLSISLVRDTQGKPLYYVAQVQDITERRAIDQIKNEFISIVSHELRTPLTAIRGSLGLLATGIYDSKPEKARRMLEIALTDSERLVRLVNDILDLERLDSGKVALEKKVCDTAELMQQAVQTVQAIADQAPITLRLVPVSAQIWAAPDAIIQTLTNLLSNALKFSPPNSTITVTAQPHCDHILFQVNDQGRGIPADKLETIFGRFQQVDASDSRHKGGTGLGLAICRSIVQQHGGQLWAESTLGEGSTFYFTLPVPQTS